MLNFIKEHFHFIAKIFVTQIGMTVFGLMLAMATMQNAALFLWTSVFSILFYIGLLYSYGWEVGIKDQIKVAAGRLEPKKSLFVWIDLAANVPNLLLGVLACVGWLFMGEPIAAADPVSMQEITVYAHEWAANLFGVCNAIARFLQAMYLGVIQTIAPNNPLMLLVIVLPAIAASGLGYYLGVSGRTLRGVFGIKTAYDVDKKKEQ